MKSKLHENRGALERFALTDEQIARLAAELGFDLAEAKQLANSMCEIAARFKFMARDPTTTPTRTDYHETIDNVISGLKTAIRGIDRMSKADEELLDQFLYFANQPAVQADNVLPEFPLELLQVCYRKHRFDPTAFSLLAEWMLKAADYYKSQLLSPGRGRGTRSPDYSPAIRSLVTDFEALPTKRKASAIKEGPFYKAALFFLQELFGSDIQDPSRQINKALIRK